ncbi:hypothetical protein HHK36_014733 [Tetracentron sinense]|uniref:Zinc finger PHD-type domain-containing protein n=1 Tax=Tetracentron sinense TaxID=13715 RepID=A0A835DG33_TETSI|nr:hypothetical protein HHK36_014733 [Tetracentron sinense]
MTHLNLTGCKKRKRGERVFRFKTFGEPGHPVEFNGSFRQNIRDLLEFGHQEANLCCGMLNWSFQLELNRHPPIHISLFIIEEPIGASVNRHCNRCQYVGKIFISGWGHHMICNKKYHFVVPSKRTVLAAAACLTCEGSSGGTEVTTGKSNLIELQGHLMHGVFHSNGFGHLLCANGVERGSQLAGHEIMDFWDRICTRLRARLDPIVSYIQSGGRVSASITIQLALDARQNTEFLMRLSPNYCSINIGRKVSLNDVSQKRSMDLRLLHGVAYGKSWFGHWGYSFGHGSYGVTQPMYQKAIEAIQGMPLCLLIHHFGSSNRDIPVIFHRYQTMAGHSLVMLGDLFRFMLELKGRLPLETCPTSGNSGFMVETTCRWSPKRVKMATRVIVEALRREDFRWVSRQEVRDAARAYIGDTGLLDFVLKSLGNHVVGKYLVRRSLNPVTKVLEYCLEDISNTFPNQEIKSLNHPKAKAHYQITRLQLMKDMFYFYKCILKEQRPTVTTGIFTAIPVATRIILDTKHFVKDYGGDLSLKMDENLKLLCTVLLRNKNEISEGIKKTLQPYEFIVLPTHATIGELKLEVEKTFREAYWGLRSFIVDSIVGLNTKDSDLVFGLVEAGCRLVFEGRIEETEGIYENSTKNNCIVDCPCGATEDDGERMISCDICEVWQHTRCVRISNTEDLPHIFICNRCENDIMLFPSLP